MTILLTVVGTLLVLTVAVLSLRVYNLKRYPRTPRIPRNKKEADKLKAKLGKFEAQTLRTMNSKVLVEVEGMSDAFMEAEMVLATMPPEGLMCQELVDQVAKMTTEYERAMNGLILAQSIVGMDRRASQFNALASIVASAVEYGFFAGRSHQSHGYSLPMEKAQS